jgi:hypothetical protein
MYTLISQLNIDDIHTLDVKGRSSNMIGGYIDYITEKDMTHPVMKGMDDIGRQFLSIKQLLAPYHNSMKTINIHY